MSDSEDHQAVPDPVEASTQEAQRLQRRRRFLRVTASGMPLVVTLLSGRMAAAVSTSDCAARLPAWGAGDRCVEGVDQSQLSTLHYAQETDVAIFSPAVDLSGNGGGANAADWCVIYTDAGGNIAGAIDGSAGYGASGTTHGPPDAGFYAMTDSCWSSFQQLLP